MGQEWPACPLLGVARIPESEVVNPAQCLHAKPERWLSITLVAEGALAF